MTAVRSVTLAELARESGGLIQTGPFGSQLHASDYVDEGVPVIMPKNIGDGRVVPDEIARVPEEDAVRLSRHRVQPGDIVYSRRGDVERHALIRDHESGWLCGTGCLLVRIPGGTVVPRYLSSFLRTEAARSWIVAHAIGATMANLNTTILGELSIRLPPLPEQRAIAEILGALDDKLELNERMNATLDEMARALFKSWFVDFDPVRAKSEGRQPSHMDAATAALFSDSFEESALGPIPAGWRVREVQELGELNRWTLGKNDELDTLDYIEISEVSRGKINRIQRYERGTEPSRARRRLRHGDTVLSTVRPDRESYFLALAPEPTLIASTGFAVLSPSLAPWSFVHAAMTQPEVFERLGHLADGAAYPAVRADVVGAQEIVWGGETIADAYHQAAAPLYELASQNRRESETLADLRDTLLPKLISGELRVAPAA